MGLKNVWLANGYSLHDTPYGRGVSFKDVEGLTRAVCLALARKPGKIPKWANRMVRLVYEAHADGDAAICRVVERINDIDRLVNRRIVLEQTARRGWQARFEEDGVEAAA